MSVSKRYSTFDGHCLHKTFLYERIGFAEIEFFRKRL